MAYITKKCGLPREVEPDISDLKHVFSRLRIQVQAILHLPVLDGLPLFSLLFPFVALDFSISLAL